MTEYTKQMLIEEWKKECLNPNKAETIEFSSRLAWLTEYQGKVIAIGELIEQLLEAKESEVIVHEMENYCEEIFAIGEVDSDNETFVENIHSLEEHYNDIANLINNIEVKHLAVFVPYKYSMWDCLASIYYAVVEDSAWDCVIMPVPYANLNEDGEVKEWVYEGGDFSPLSVHKYDINFISQTRPDVIFVHNPYDDTNKVTRVFSDFFSVNLKKYTDRLVYVPYFFTGEKFPDDHCSFASYENFDYIVVPSQHAKMQLSNYVPQEKILALGSPKNDYMIRLGNEKKMPKEWENRIRGRKTVLYNVSLSAVLNQRFNTIFKMRQVFNYFKRNNEMVLWWRPHPLIKETMQSMCPELLGAYEEMERAFLLENIGIYDTTSDSNRAVACTDAFMGDSSSMQNLFGMAGKPIFLVSNYVYDIPEDEDKNILFMWQPAVFFADDSLEWKQYNQGGRDNSIIFYNADNRTLYKYFSDTKNVTEIYKIYWDVKSLIVVNADVPDKSELRVFPRLSTDPLLIYKINEDNWEEITDAPIREINLEEYSGTIWYGNKTILTPGINPDVVVVADDSQEISRYSWKTDYLNQFRTYPNEPLIGSYLLLLNKIYMLSARTNAVIVFDIETCSFQYSMIGTEQVRFSGMCYENKTQSIWFIAWDGSVIVKWQLVSNKFDTYELKVPGFSPRLSAFYSSGGQAFIRAFWWKDELILCPYLANMFLKVDIETGKVRKWDINLPFEIGQRKGTYFASPNNFGWGMPIDDKHFFMQSSYDGSMLQINLETDEVESIKLLRDNKGESHLLPKDRNMKGESGCYVFYEDALHFCFEDMMNFLAKASEEELNVKRQKASSLNGIEHADGTCGKQIFEYIKSTC